jgi:energy-coupling factor transporter ATP-binding protein EcfA2
MDKVKQVTVRRFKRLQQVTVKLGEVTLLIGANNSGKSSVLQALHFAVAIAQSAKLVGEGVSWANDRFELSLNPAQLLYSPVSDVMSLANGGTLQESRASRVEIEFETEAGERTVVGLKRGRNRNVSVAIEGRALGEKFMSIERPFTIYAPGLAGIPKEERYLSPGVVRRLVARGDANLVLRNVLLMLSSDAAAWAAFCEDMQAIFPGIAVSLRFDESTDEHIIATFALPGGPVLPLDAAGTSILQASQLLAYISLFKPSVLILDEPDSHLHPDNQRGLCQLVCRLAGRRGFQAVVSSHSRHVLDVMKTRAATIWMSKGEIVSDTDLSTTTMLLDLGALDSVDYFTNASLRCVVATEDSDQERVRALLWSNGFVEEETEVASYAGCSKTDAAIVLGQFLKEKASALHLVIHRDADYLDEAGAKKFTVRLSQVGIGAFLTEHSDVEGYFVCAAHLSYLNPSLTTDRAQELIDQATRETRDESIKSIVNLRTEAAFRARKDTGATPNHGEIAVTAASDYDASPATMRRGDSVLGKLTALLQAETKSNPKIFEVSPHLKSATLAGLAKQIWQPSAPSRPAG